MRWLSDIMGRPVFALLGAFGLFNLVSDFTAIDEGFREWLDAWQAITRPVWDFLLGWSFDLFSWNFPTWLKDYLTAGLIISGSFFRSINAQRRFKAVLGHPPPELKVRIGEASFVFLIGTAAWPVLIIIIAYGYIGAYWLQPDYFEKEREKYDSDPVNRALGFRLDVAGMKESDGVTATAFFEGIVCFMILIALNYAMLFDWLRLS